MKDSRYFDLRCLTEKIFYIREIVLKSINPSSDLYHEAIDKYDELWRKRNELEQEIFNG